MLDILCDRSQEVRLFTQPSSRKYKAWTPDPWTPSMDPAQGLGPSKSTSFPGPCPYLECGAGKGPGIGWSRAHLNIHKNTNV